MKRMAMIKDGVVLSVSQWEEDESWTPDPKFTWADASENHYIGAGWLYDGHNFSAPPKVEE